MTEGSEAPTMQGARATTSRVVGPGYRNHQCGLEITNYGIKMREGTAAGAEARERRLAERDAAEAEPEYGRARLAAAASGIAAESTASTAAATAKAEMMQSTDDPEFRLAVEVLYHGSRQAWLAGLHRWFMFAAILFGAGVTVTIGGEKVCGLLAAASAAADIAFDFVGRAQVHGDIRRRYLEMVGRLAAESDYGEDAFAGDWMKVSADEPPVYRWAYEVADRNARISLKPEVPDAQPWWKIALAHVWRG